MGHLIALIGAGRTKVLTGELDTECWWSIRSNQIH